MKKTKPLVKANSAVKSGSSQGAWDNFFAEAGVDLPDRDQPPMQNRDFSGRSEVMKKKGRESR